MICQWRADQLLIIIDLRDTHKSRYVEIELIIYVIVKAIFQLNRKKKNVSQTVNFIQKGIQPGKIRK